jgi:hypothetical protein
MDSPSKQKKNAEANRLRRFKDVIKQLTILGIHVDEPDIKKYDKYLDILKNARHLLSGINKVSRKAHEGMEEISRQRRIDEENERLREEQENKPLDQSKVEEFKEDPRRNPLVYSKDNLIYLQDTLWKDSPRKKGQTRKRRHRPKTKKKVKKKVEKKVKKKVKKHTSKRTQKPKPKKKYTKK